MIERLLSPRLADIVEAIERIRFILNGVSLEAFEQDWEKRWLVERGIEILSEASRHLPDDLKTRRAHILGRKSQASAASCGMITITLRRTCCGSWRKTIYPFYMKSAMKN